MKALTRTFPRTLVFLAAAALLVPVLRANDDDESEGSTARVKFSDPGKPGTLKLALPWAEAHITGTDGNEVVVTSSLDQKGKRELDNEGFRRLDEDVTFELVEKDNVAVITVAGDNLWATHGAEFEIKVPRNTNLVIATQIGGDIEVEGVEGDLDINSMNGEIRLQDVASSAVVNTMNGEISASFKKAPNKPVSLTSMNGEIDLRLPGDTKANLRMRTHHGSIRTNFPAGALETKTEKITGRTRTGDANIDREMDRETARLDRERAKMEREAAKAAAEIARAQVNVHVNVNGEDVVAAVPPIPPVPAVPNFGGKSIVGTLNGGGVDIKLTSMNGTITLRESK